MASSRIGTVNGRAPGIELSAVTVAFQRAGRAVTACEDVSFVGPRGDFVSIVGPSGCGKTTVLNTIAGFIKPVRGSVRVNDVPVARPSADCTVVFQSYALFPWMTVEQNLSFGLRMKSTPRSHAAELIERYLAMMGLSGTNRLYPYELSGGMQQRVALARALVIEPETILMDEPFAAVDLQTRENLQNELASIRAATPQTVLLVTHSVDEAVYLSDRVIVMGGKPGHVRASFDIPLPHPRRPEMRSEAEYLRLRDTIALHLRTAA